MKRTAFWLGLVLVLATSTPGRTAAQAAAQTEAQTATSPDAVRLLWTPGTVAAGKVEVEALLLDPDIRRLVFLLDGEVVAERSKPPWRENIRFAEPPRTQQLTVRALGADGRVLGEDQAEINRRRQAFRIFLDEVDSAHLRGHVALPPGAELAAVTLELDGQQVGSFAEEAFALTLEAPAHDGQVVRALARLRDGREIEGARVVGAASDVASVDVRLVQVQVLATDRDGRPLRDLKASDFKLFENRHEQRIDRVWPAGDVSLVLGLVIDASGSMEPIWPAVRGASDAFLDTVVGERDQAFLIDFADQVRLLQGPTNEKHRLEEALAGVRPGGLTALYDSIVFAALQFRDRPGRRALVVITDGVDYGSQADPDRAVEISRKLGIPVYVVSLSGGSNAGGRGSAGQVFAQGGQVQEMKLITEPTGGRLLRTQGGRRGGQGDEGLLRAFRQIADELRSQYLLTYYTNRPAADLDARDIDIRLPEKKGAVVRSVLAWDQIQ